MTVTHEQHGQPAHEFAPGELAERLPFRQAMAAFMAHYMFEGVDIARELAEQYGIRDPARRYQFLADVTVSLVQLPESQQHSLDTEPKSQWLLNHICYLLVPAIQDAFFTGCGAARFLEDQGRGAEAPSIIPRSTGLLAVSRASKNGAAELRERLGDPVASKYLRLRDRAGTEVVDFTTEAKAIIDEYPSPYGGCAATALEDPRPTSTAPNLLVAYWQEISAYAFPA